MHLYLVQHGEAWDTSHDGERSLSDRGTESLEKIRSFLKDNRAVTVAGVFHSGKLRAQQTAAILAEAVNAAGNIKATDGMKPMDDPAVWADRLRDMHEDVMLVGHLPHLGKLAGLLLSGDADHRPIHFHNGGVVCLFRDADNQWTVDWIVIPGILR